MSSCRTIRRQLPLFVGGDLAVPAAADVREHLRGCQACRREAAGLQQPLLRLREVEPAVGDEAMFTAMQQAIVARVAGAAAGSVRPVGRPLARPWLVGAAAAALVSFLVGWGWVRTHERPSALQRPPIAMPVGHGDTELAVPYAGDRVPLRLLGDEPGSSSTQGPGMLGRWRLRSLVETPVEPGEPMAPVPVAPTAEPQPR
ncbi:MAG: zf-HC2 domain-containing protein [Planctomycetes bacterium]|nr:zf-HC2 domain-containing protein [Planctomycetota bacterium]